MNALRVLRGAAWGCLAVIAILSLLPAEEMVRTGLSGHIEHAITYAAASVIVLLNPVQFETHSFQFRTPPFGRPWKAGTTGF
jgi:hypothetical protein